MKKKNLPQRLSLTKATVRRLSNAQIGGIAGAVRTQFGCDGPLSQDRFTDPRGNPCNRTETCC